MLKIEKFTTTQLHANLKITANEGARMGSTGTLKDLINLWILESLPLS